MSAENYNSAPYLLEFGPGGYPYIDDKGNNALALPEHLQDHPVFKDPYWFTLREVVAGSFVVSGGRQDKQLCEEIAYALLHKEEGGVPNYDVLDAPEVVETLRHWTLPAPHTRAPLRKRIAQDGEMQVAGVYHFWLLAYRDAVRVVNEPDFTLPSDKALRRRYRDCGVRLYATSSSNGDELNTIRAAFGDIRQDTEVVTGGLDRFIQRHCLLPHMAGLVHWASVPRTRIDRGDPHEPRYRTAIKYAAERPPAERTRYDRLLIREGLNLRHILSMEWDELVEKDLEEIKETHDDAVKLHNDTHEPKDKLKTFLDDIPLPEVTLG